MLTPTSVQWVLASLFPRSVTVWWLVLLLHIQELLGLNGIMKISIHGWWIVIACHNPSRQYFKTSRGCLFPDGFNLLLFDFICYIRVVFRTTLLSKPCKLSDQRVKLAVYFIYFQVPEGCSSFIFHLVCCIDINLTFSSEFKVYKSS